MDLLSLCLTRNIMEHHWVSPSPSSVSAHQICLLLLKLDTLQDGLNFTQIVAHPHRLSDDAGPLRGTKAGRPEQIRPGATHHPALGCSMCFLATPEV